MEAAFSCSTNQAAHNGHRHTIFIEPTGKSAVGLRPDLKINKTRPDPIGSTLRTLQPKAGILRFPLARDRRHVVHEIGIAPPGNLGPRTRPLYRF